MQCFILRGISMERMSLAGKWILHMDKQDRDYEADVPCSDWHIAEKRRN